MAPYLIRDKKFNDKAVEQVLKNFRESIKIAKLDKIDFPDEQDEGITDESDDASDDKKEKVEMSNTQSLEQSAPVPIAKPDQAVTEMPVMVGNGKIARIPYPISEKYFDLLIGTLNLYRDEIVRDEPEE